MKSTPFGQFLMINICSKCIPIFQKNIYHDYLSMYHDINMILSYCSALLFIQHMSRCTEWVLFRHEGVFFFSFFFVSGTLFHLTVFLFFPPEVQSSPFIQCFTIKTAFSEYQVVKRLLVFPHRLHSFSLYSLSNSFLIFSLSILYLFLSNPSFQQRQCFLIFSLFCIPLYLPLLSFLYFSSSPAQTFPPSAQESSIVIIRGFPHLFFYFSSSLVSQSMI